MEAESKYAGLVFDDIIVDACAMKMVINPQGFDVIVTTNLFGDILSDLAAGLVGGLGVAPGANVGKDVWLGEAVHGTAPDIVGTGKANPSAMLMAAAMMFDHLGRPEEGDRLRQAIIDAIAAKQGTGDVKGTGTTRSFTDALLERL